MRHQINPTLFSVHARNWRFKRPLTQQLPQQVTCGINFNPKVLSFQRRHISLPFLSHSQPTSCLWSSASFSWSSVEVALWFCWLLRISSTSWRWMVLSSSIARRLSASNWAWAWLNARSFSSKSRRISSTYETTKHVSIFSVGIVECVVCQPSLCLCQAKRSQHLFTIPRP